MGRVPPSPPTPAIPPPELKRFLSAFRKINVLVIGDLMLDEFLWGKVSRISPEAPVPVVWVQTESMMPGGAANVANNIRALGGRVELSGVVGADRWGALLLEELEARQIGTAAVLREPSRPTIVKTRVIAHHQQVVRVDRERKAALDPSTVDQVVALAKRALKRADAVIIEDYGKGVISRALLEQVIPAARAGQKVITVDPKEDHFDLYHGVTSITPNRAEAGVALGRELETEDAVLGAGEELLRRLHSESVLITLGEDGMCLFEKSGRRTRIPTVAQEVFDVAGAGDTVIATFTLALAAGAAMPQAAQLANLAAGIVVGKLGVASTSPEEILARVNGRPAPAEGAGSRLHGPPRSGPSRGGR